MIFEGFLRTPDRTLHAARMRVKAAAGHEKAPGYHPRGLVFILEILGCGPDARYDPRRDAARSAEMGQGTRHSVPVGRAGSIRERYGGRVFEIGDPCR